MNRQENEKKNTHKFYFHLHTAAALGANKIYDFTVKV